jgi:tetratricopeptide (TPR) repeat protein
MCNNENSKEKKIKNIGEAESGYMTNRTLENGQKLMDLYENYVQNYPEDTLSPDLLLRCAGVAAATQQGQYSIMLYQRIYDEYPESNLRPFALLQQALAYDNMEDVEKAKLLYEQFLDVFPNHPYAEEVKQLLSLVNKTPEELEQLMEQWDTIGNSTINEIP